MLSFRLFARSTIEILYEYLSSLKSVQLIVRVALVNVVTLTDAVELYKVKVILTSFVSVTVALANVQFLLTFAYGAEVPPVSLNSASGLVIS